LVQRATQNKRLNLSKAKQIKRGREALNSSATDTAPPAKRARVETIVEPPTAPGNIIEQGGRAGEEVTSDAETEAAISVVGQGNDHDHHQNGGHDHDDADETDDE
jgi:hypothetical protein